MNVGPMSCHVIGDGSRVIVLFATFHFNWSDAIPADIWRLAWCGHLSKDVWVSFVRVDLNQVFSSSLQNWSRKKFKNDSCIKTS